MSASSSANKATLGLLNQAFPEPSVAQQVYSQKLEHRPLSLNPADIPDARESRRQKRLSKLKRKRKPRPLSAKERRALRIFDVPKTEIRFILAPFDSYMYSYTKFMVLNGLWNKYISEILSHVSHKPTTAVNGPALLKADYHGSLMTVENCRCTSRIGISGICVKETKSVFEIVTAEDKLVKIPKEKSLFRIYTKFDVDGSSKEVEWRLWGDQFLLRSGERAGRKFSGRTIRGKALLEL
jgi:ribonuclease P protein subunit POP4